jgi:acetylornithine/succinyldiaminopimelate/putrescine aminotransferase
MIENSLKMGEIMNDKLNSIKSSLIKETRGRGLFRSIELKKGARVDGNDLAYELMNVGLLTKATHNYTIRLAPPLVINEDQVSKACNLIIRGIRSLERLNRERKRETREIKNQELVAKKKGNEQINSQEDKKALKEVILE